MAEGLKCQQLVIWKVLHFLFIFINTLLIQLILLGGNFIGLFINYDAITTNTEILQRKRQKVNANI